MFKLTALISSWGICFNSFSLSITNLAALLPWILSVYYRILLMTGGLKGTCHLLGPLWDLPVQRNWPCDNFIRKHFAASGKGPWFTKGACDLIAALPRSGMQN